MTFLPPVPLTSIAAVEDWQVDPVRRTRLLSSPILFEVLVHTVSEPVTLDARNVPYPVIDGHIRIHESRRRGLRTIPALLVIPDRFHDSAGKAPGKKRKVNATGGKTQTGRPRQRTRAESKRKPSRKDSSAGE